MLLSLQRDSRPLTDSPSSTYKAKRVPVAPPASSDGVRAVFRANRRKDTRPEVELRSALFSRGLRFLVDATPAGVSRRRRVDVLLRGSRMAVLVHGCFWHCCPEHFSMPVRNRQWWEAKFAAIKHRDADTELRLREAGWLSVVVWEHERSEAAAERIERLHRSRVQRTKRGAEGAAATPVRSVHGTHQGVVQDRERSTTAPDGSGLRVAGDPG